MERLQNLNLEGLIQLLIQQDPERMDVVNALKNCKEGYWSNRGYYSFVRNVKSNKKETDLQILESIVLEHKTLGTIVIDFMEDNTIGGLEFIEFLN
jgi:hypothetical protein